MLCAVRVGSAVVAIPNTASKTAQRYRDTQYMVYEIYSKSGPFGLIKKTWKFGITRVGSIRPESQLSKCAKQTGHSCDYKWKDENVKGYYNARMKEAKYTLGYALRHRKCPPGMPKCM